MYQPRIGLASIVLASAGTLLAGGLTVGTPGEFPPALERRTLMARPDSEGFLVNEFPVFSSGSPQQQTRYKKFGSVDEDFVTTPDCIKSLDGCSFVEYDVYPYHSYGAELLNFWRVGSADGQMLYSFSYYQNEPASVILHNDGVVYSQARVCGQDLKEHPLGSWSRSVGYESLWFRDPLGALALLTEREVRTDPTDAGDPSDPDGYTISWTNFPMAQVKYPGVALPGNAAAGLSMANESRPILLFAREGDLVRWSFSDSGIDEEVFTGDAPPPDSQLLAAAESDDELVLFYSIENIVTAWSSSTGSVELGPTGCPEASKWFAWFDDTGTLHAYHGELPASTACATHFWRAGSEPWSSVDFAALVQPEILKEVWFDISELRDLKVATVSDDVDSSRSTARYHQLQGGAWSTGVVAASPSGSMFENVSTGPVANGDKLIVYRQVQAECDHGRWFYARAGADVAPQGQDPVPAIAQYLLDGHCALTAYDTNGDGAIDAGDLVIP